MKKGTTPVVHPESEVVLKFKETIKMFKYESVSTNHLYFHQHYNMHSPPQPITTDMVRVFLQFVRENL